MNRVTKLANVVYKEFNGINMTTAIDYAVALIRYQEGLPSHFEIGEDGRPILVNNKLVRLKTKQY